MPFLAVLAGIALFSVMDGLMKGGAMTVGAYMAMQVRSLFGLVIMLPLWKWRGGTMPDFAAMNLHALRGGVSAAMATTFFYGIQFLPLAEGIALSFIAPLIALYLAAVVLGEKVGRGAIVASLLGLAGVLVIAAARFDGFQLDPEAGRGIAAILFSAVAYAVNLILQRKQAQIAGPVEVALFQTVWVGLFLALLSRWLMGGADRQAPNLISGGAALAMASLTTFSWAYGQAKVQIVKPIAIALAMTAWAGLLLVLFSPLLVFWPDNQTLAQIAASALLAMISLMILSWGYGRAEAQALLPIEYTAFIWAALVGWLMFGEALTLPTVAGAVLIVLGCWIATRPQQAAHVEATAL